MFSSTVVQCAPYFIETRRALSDNRHTRFYRFVLGIMHMYVGFIHLFVLKHVLSLLKRTHQNLGGMHPVTFFLIPRSGYSSFFHVAVILLSTQNIQFLLVSKWSIVPRIWIIWKTVKLDVGTRPSWRVWIVYWHNFRERRFRLAIVLALLTNKLYCVGIGYEKLQKWGCQKLQIVRKRWVWPISLFAMNCTINLLIENASLVRRGSIKFMCQVSASNRGDYLHVWSWSHWMLCFLF